MLRPVQTMGKVTIDEVVSAPSGIKVEKQIKQLNIEYLIVFSSAEYTLK